MTAESTANVQPIKSLMPFKSENGSVNNAIPVTPRKKLNRSYLLTRSPIIKKLIRDVKNGLYSIITILDSSVNFTAKNSVAKPRNPVMHLILKHTATCLLISKGDTLIKYNKTETIIIATKDRRYNISKTVTVLVLYSHLTAQISRP